MQNSKTLYILLIVLSVAVLTLAGIFGYNLINDKLRDQRANQPVVISPTPIPTTTPTPSPTPTVTPTPTPTTVPTPIVTPTPVPTPVLKSFSSTRYNLNLKYPESMGDVRVEFISAYFNDEIITSQTH